MTKILTRPQDPPIKLFAQRYTHLGIDAIAGRDLGFAQRGKNPAPVAAPIPVVQPPTAPAAEREKEHNSDRIPPPRRASPEPRRRRDPSPPPAKRFKPSSPPPRRDGRPLPREREGGRWGDEGGSTPRRAASPAQPPKDATPAALIYFLSLLPSASAFDGKKYHIYDHDAS